MHIPAPSIFSKVNAMENPCNKCLLKVNCTAICPDKENHKALIMNAITQSKSAMGQNYNYFKQYREYIRRLKITNQDEEKIIHRADVAMNPN